MAPKKGSPQSGGFLGARGVTFVQNIRGAPEKSLQSRPSILPACPKTSANKCVWGETYLPYLPKKMLYISLGEPQIPLLPLPPPQKQKKRKEENKKRRRPRNPPQAPLRNRPPKPEDLRRLSSRCRSSSASTPFTGHPWRWPGWACLSPRVSGALSCYDFHPKTKGTREFSIFGLGSPKPCFDTYPLGL